MTHSFINTNNNMPNMVNGSDREVKYSLTILIFSVILFITSTIIDVNSLPKVSSGFFSIHINDILILVLLFISFQNSFLNSQLCLPTFMLFFICIISIFYGVIMGYCDANSAFREFRAILYYILIIPVTTSVVSLQAYGRLYKLILILGYITAFAMFIQYTTGISSQFLAGRVESLQTMDNVNIGITRILPPGQTLVFLLFVLNLSKFLFLKKVDSSFFLSIINIVTFGMAMILTFNRSYWTGALLSIFILLVLSGFKRLLFGILAMSFMLMAIIIVSNFYPNSKLLNAVSERFSTIISTSNTLKKDASLTGRKYEYIKAWEVISQNPIIGIGLGSEWRRKMHADDNMTRYTHNGFLWILMKLGIVGLFVFIMFYYKLFRYYFSNIISINNWEENFAIKGHFAFLISAFMANMVNPMFMQYFSVPLLAISFGSVFNLIRIAQGGAKRQSGI